MRDDNIMYSSGARVGGSRVRRGERAEGDPKSSRLHNRNRFLMVFVRPRLMARCRAVHCMSDDAFSRTGAVGVRLSARGPMRRLFRFIFPLGFTGRA